MDTNKLVECYGCGLASVGSSITGILQGIKLFFCHRCTYGEGATITVGKEVLVKLKTKQVEELEEYNKREGTDRVAPISYEFNI